MIVINVLDHSKHQSVVIILSHYNDVSLPIGTSFVGDLDIGRLCEVGLSGGAAGSVC